MTGAPEPAQPSILLMDTHVLLWLVEGYGSLGPGARATIDSHTTQNSLVISAITPWEIGLLTSKGRLRLGSDVLKWVLEVLAKPGLSLAPLKPEIAVACSNLPFEMHADPADRILVATARHLGATLVTADERLLRLAAKMHIRALNAEQ